MKNRQWNEIQRDIISVCNGGANITGVMFRAYVTHAQARENLAYLASIDLIRYDALTRLYHATPKGLELLRAAEAMSELFPIATGKRIDLDVRRFVE